MGGRVILEFVHWRDGRFAMHAQWPRGCRRVRSEACSLGGCAVSRTLRGKQVSCLKGFLHWTAIVGASGFGRGAACLDLHFVGAALGRDCGAVCLIHGLARSLDRSRRRAVAGKGAPSCWLSLHQGQHSSNPPTWAGACSPRQRALRRRPRCRNVNTSWALCRAEQSVLDRPFVNVIRDARRATFSSAHAATTAC